MKMEEIRDHANKAEKVWGQAYDVLWPLINKLKLHIGVEIGVAFGGHTEKLLSKTKMKMYAIDPYKHFDSYDDVMNMTQSEFDILYRFAKKRLSVYGDRCKLIRKQSHIAAKLLGSVDFVYLDGDHSYEAMCSDLCDWFPKIIEGGVIAGHDYGHESFPGVKKAVDKYLGRFNYAINTHPSGVWWVEKHKLNVSFIIPAYNCADTLEASVNSIQEGNYEKGDEIIIVNDGSVDSTDKLIRTLKRNDKTIRSFSHKFNAGGGTARNTAVEHSNNNLIFCLDSDNILIPNSISKLKQELLNSISDGIAFEEIRFFHSNGNIAHSWKLTEKEYQMSNYLTTIFVPGASGNYLYTKISWQQAGGYPQDSQALDTWGFGLRQAMSGSTILVLRDSFYLHRIGHESYWNRSAKAISPSLLALQILIPYLPLLTKKDQDYLMSKKHRNNWLENLNKNPIYINRKTSYNKLLKFINIIKKLL